jgi:hypothetical protein
MQNWKNFLIKELAVIIQGLADGLLTDPDYTATRLRQIAYKIDTNQKAKR